MTTKTIDIEPKWVDVLKAVQIGHLNDAGILLQACEIADIVRQAQKAGHKSVVFTFSENNEIEVEVVEA